MEINLINNVKPYKEYFFKQLHIGDMFVQEGGIDYAVLIKIEENKAVSICSDEEIAIIHTFGTDEICYSVDSVTLTYELETE